MKNTKKNKNRVKESRDSNKRIFFLKNALVMRGIAMWVEALKVKGHQCLLGIKLHRKRK